MKTSKNALILKHKPFLKAVSKGKKALRTLLRNATEEEIQTISEIAKNVLLGKIQSTKYIKKLKPYKIVLRKLANPTVSVHQKRKTLQQKGGLLLPALLAPILGTLISSAISA